ncbi:DUF4354 family protein [Enterobacteriaceae bacterium ML5]|nr:DUF4354 family protein [Enterobacteriaceae bacterium ML5]
MKKTNALFSTSLLLSAFFVSGLATADVNIIPTTPSSQDLIITVTSLSDQEETTVENGVKHHAKLFILNIFNTTDKPLSFATKNGCFKAENEDGSVSITQKIIDPEILKVLPPKGESRGYAVFSTKDTSVLKTNYVIWSTNCSYHK